MSGREVRRFVEDLLRGRRPKPFRPDDAEAAEIRAAIELRASRPGSGEPGEEFVADLHRRLAAEMARPEPAPEPTHLLTGTRRQVMAGVSIAAAAAAIGAVVDRSIAPGRESGTPAAPPPEETLVPVAGEWRAVASSADVPEGGVYPFELGSVTGFVHRTNGKLQAVSGICTHQGCRLWFDGPTDRLRCPCHATAFAVTGEVLTHQLPVAPGPLPHIRIRDNDGTVEVYVPSEPA
ncbi:Rieske 2Fe-2S domain-containing protein [Rhodococcus spelaei]|uniref:Rieske 2Fe-2S domain-containing protein n=1 Tax=Rhodococcus spelaei TaxID=2546320 RepID=A0A541B7K1_9NOCA|nr:Rieske 2Fe-2S domain-containing protein [Rhodococcus spelaei]TQF68295.1 Rieske 2Fe-2S domain-containing protein [Rhodococcus spelaei]